MKKKTDGQKFAILRRSVEKIGMHIMSIYELWKLLCKGLKPPDAERIKETMDQFALKITVHGYSVIFYTSFNPTLTENDGKKVVGMYAEFGGMWIRIFDKNGNKIMARKRFRGETNEKRLPLELDALITGLRKRPTFNTQYGKSKMFLWDPLSTSDSKHYPPEAIKNCKWYERYMLKRGYIKPELIWVSSDISGEKKFIPFSKGLSVDQARILRTLNYRRAYYYENSEPNLRESEYRKKWEGIPEEDLSKNYAVSLHC